MNNDYYECIINPDFIDNDIKNRIIPQFNNLMYKNINNYIDEGFSIYYTNSSNQIIN